MKSSCTKPFSVCYWRLRTSNVSRFLTHMHAVHVTFRTRFVTIVTVKITLLSSWSWRKKLTWTRSNAFNDKMNHLSGGVSPRQTFLPHPSMFGICCFSSETAFGRNRAERTDVRLLCIWIINIASRSTEMTSLTYRWQVQAHHTIPISRLIDSFILSSFHFLFLLTDEASSSLQWDAFP